MENNTTEKNNLQQINIDKLLLKKQKKQTSLDKYLSDYKKTLDNKSLQDLNDEIERLEQQRKISLITAIIGAIAFLALLIMSIIFAPISLIPIIAIPCVIGIIASVGIGAYDYKIINKMRDIVYAKRVRKQPDTPYHGNSMTQKRNNNTSRNNNVQNIQSSNNSNKSNQKQKADKIVAKKLSNTNNSRQSHLNKSNTKINTVSKRQLKEIKQNDIKNDHEQADHCIKKTRTQVLNGTLDLLSHLPKDENEYNRLLQLLNDKNTSETEQALARRCIIKYRIWNQLSQEEQRKYKEHCNTQQKKPFRNDNDWQLKLYNQWQSQEQKSKERQNIKILGTENNGINDSSNNNNSTIKKSQFNKNMQSTQNDGSDQQTSNKEGTAGYINENTLNKILSGTLDLSSDRPKSQQEYEQCKNDLKCAKTSVKQAMLQQRMIKYEIWNQLSQEGKRKYEEYCNTAQKEPFNGDKDWQVKLYNQHLEEEEYSKQRFSKAVYNIITKKEKDISEERQAVKTAILKGSQQKNNIQLLGVSQQTGNYSPGTTMNKQGNTLSKSFYKK